MKKMRFVLFAVAAMAAASCAKELAPENGKENTPAANLVPMTFTAGTEATKVALQEDGKTLHWETTDQLKVFDGVSNELPAFTTTESGASVTFAGQVSDGAAGPFYALYPYQAAATFGASTITTAEYGNVITATVPAEQTAVAGGVPANAFIAAAVSDNKDNFTFKTICGFIKFQLSEEDAAGAVAVSISGNDLAAIAGDVEIFFSKAGAEAFGQDYVRGATKDYVTLTGSFKADTDYYFAIRSNKFASGFTMTIKYEDGSCKHVTTTQAAPQNISRNMVMNIGKPVFKAGLPNDLYIAWQHGLDVDVAGKAFNKATYGEATRIKKDDSSGKAGVYIIDSGFTFTSNLLDVTEPLIIFGRYNDRSSSLKKGKIHKLSGANALVAYKNLNVTWDNNNQPFQITGDSDCVVMDNCNFDHIRNTFITATANNVSSVLNSAGITNCDIKINGTNKSAAYMFLSSHTGNGIQSFTFKNNVVYFVPGTVTALTDFKAIEVKSGTVGDVIVENNTFDKTTIPNSAFVRIHTLTGQLVIKSNLFNEVNQTTMNSGLLGITTTTGTIPASGEVSNNFYYKADTENTYKLSLATAGLDNLTKKYSPQLALDPILTDWDPANGKFGIAETITYYNSGSGQNITVSTAGVGAQR